MPLVTDRSQLDTSIGEDGQQKDYLVLSEAERRRGFVAPVRTTYRHVGRPGPRYPLRDLKPEELRYNENLSPAEKYVKFEEYPPSLSSASTGRFWSQADLDAVGKGCNHTTTMARELAETYAAQPDFYSGTFCSYCRKHLPVGEDGEFIWEDGSRVGSKHVPLQRGDETLADAIIGRLNNICRNPEIRADIAELFAKRVPVSETTLRHATLQCDADDQTLGMIGVLNGICGLIGGYGDRASWGFITAIYSDDGDLERFDRTKEK